MSSMEVQKFTAPEKISDDDDTTGIGRSYLCIFCKRGFCTAQALGGHMNIHRKDRAKTTKQTHGILYQYSPYANHSHFFLSNPHRDLRSYAASSRQRPHELRLFGNEREERDWIGGQERRVKMRGEEEGGLDLELRLGP